MTAPAGATVTPFSNGYIYDTSKSITVRAEPISGVASVVFKLDGQQLRIESSAPYSVAGDTNGVYTAWKPAAGNHTLVATPFSATGGKGTAGQAITVSFTAIAEATPTPTPTPNGSSADLSVTIVDGKTSIAAGSRNTYTITVSNAGPSAVTGATINDSFPGNFTGVTYTATQLGGATGFSASGAGNINNTADMPSGSKITYKANGKLSSAATGTLSNTAQVSGPAGITDPQTSNNSVTDADAITLKADLKVTITDGKTAAVAGTKNTYTIIVTNAGPSNVTGAVIGDTFPASFTDVTYTATQSGGATGISATGSSNINDTVNMPAAAKITYKATGTISASATGSIADTATVTSPSGVNDPNNANNTAGDTDTL